MTGFARCATTSAGPTIRGPGLIDSDATRSHTVFAFARLDVIQALGDSPMIRKLATGKFRLYARKRGHSGKRRNLGTFDTLEEARKHERAVQFFKHR
jgi:hypothetical protein